MNIESSDFRVPGGKEVSLKKWPTLVKPVYRSKKEYKKLLRGQVEELSSLQRLHYASNRAAADRLYCCCRRVVYRRRAARSLMFLSGTVVPVESMPQALQYVSLVSPIRYYMEIALGIFLKGVGWSVLWPQLLALLAPGSAFAGWGWLRLKRRLYA